MIAVAEQLEKKLKQLRVRIDAPDSDTVLLRDIPTSDSFFNKPRTNLLIKRPREGMPYLICVDEDLEYIGKDQALARAFAGGQKQQGWRVLFTGRDRPSGIQPLIEQALTAVGFNGCDPRLQPIPQRTEAAETGSLLASFSTEVSTEESDEPTVGREEQIEGVVASLLQWQVRLPLIVGESGAGKTNLVRATARKLKLLRPELKVVSLELGALMSGTLFDSERESLLIALLKDAEAQRQTVVAIEHLEMGLIGVPRGHLLLSAALDRGARLIGTTLPSHLPRFAMAPLERRLLVTELNEMSISETAKVLAALREKLSQHHHLVIEESLLHAVLDKATSLKGTFPMKAISLLDAATARAVLAGESDLSLFDVYDAAARVTGGED